MDDTVKVKVVPQEATRTKKFPQVSEVTYTYITMLEHLVWVLSLADNESGLDNDLRHDLAEEVLNAAFVLRTGAEI